MTFKKNLCNLILLLALPVLSIAADRPRVFTKRTEYEKALALHSDQLASYTNYRKKIEFYKNYKVPSRETWRLTSDEWIDFFQPLLRSHGIYFDNENIRYKPAAVPKKIIWVNLMPSRGGDYYGFVISDEPIEEAIYYATTYAFDEPGDPPVFREVKKKPRPKTTLNPTDSLPSSTRMPPPVSNPVVPLETNRQRPMDFPCDSFMMPDGLKYNRSALEKNWHMMSNKQVFTGNFRNYDR